MPGETKIQYGAACEKASQLRGRIEPQLAEMGAAHGKIQPKPSGVDGAANAQLIEAIKSNSAKARMPDGFIGAADNCLWHFSQFCVIILGANRVSCAQMFRGQYYLEVSMLWQIW